MQVKVFVIFALILLWNQCNAYCGDGIVDGSEQCDLSIGCDANCFCQFPLFVNSNGKCVISSFANQTRYDLTDNKFNLTISDLALNLANGLYVVAIGGGGADTVSVSGGIGGIAYGFIPNPPPVITLAVGAAGRIYNGGTGAFNGGNGGLSPNNWYSSGAIGYGGGGGGASAIWYPGGPIPIMVAGGGGGAGGGRYPGVAGRGGAGGGLTGQNGFQSNECQPGGTGGSQSSPGFGGCIFNGQNFTDCGFGGNGGNGGDGSGGLTGSDEGGGGGGGAGFYGGGGGRRDTPGSGPCGANGGAGGGAGGSSHIENYAVVAGGVLTSEKSAWSTSVGANNANGAIWIIYIPQYYCPQGCGQGVCIANSVCQCKAGFYGASCNMTCGNGILEPSEDCDRTIGCDDTCKCRGPLFSKGVAGCDLSPSANMTKYNFTGANVTLNFGSEVVVYLVVHGGGGANVQGISGGSGGAVFGYLRSYVTSLTFAVGGAGTINNGGWGALNGGMGGTGSSSWGGGGGGASAVWVPQFGTSPVLIAAGGGGAGSAWVDNSGGTGGNGGKMGGNGGKSRECQPGGTGATQTAPGLGGCNSGAGFVCGSNGGAFPLGLGGNGGTGSEAGGGGGGGGYHGGGGGKMDVWGRGTCDIYNVYTGGSGGGGGGSSFIDTTRIFSGNYGFPLSGMSGSSGSAGNNGSIWVIWGPKVSCPLGYTGLLCDQAVCGDGIKMPTEVCDSTFGCSTTTCTCITPHFVFNTSTNSCTVSPSAVLKQISAASGAQLNYYFAAGVNDTLGINNTLGVYVIAYTGKKPNVLTILKNTVRENFLMFLRIMY